MIGNILILEDDKSKAIRLIGNRISIYENIGHFPIFLKEPFEGPISSRRGEVANVELATLLIEFESALLLSAFDFSHAE